MKLNAFRMWHVNLIACLVVAILQVLSVGLYSEYPNWWASSGVVNPGLEANDYGLVNGGQVKNMVLGAISELQHNLPDGAGETIDWIGVILERLVENPGINSNDYAPLNIGQLKAIAKPFHDRLQEEGYMWAVWGYPITVDLINDYAPVNIGQLKAMFAFDLTSDFNGNGLPDWWEYKEFRNKTADVMKDYSAVLDEIVGADDPDEDGASNIEEYQRHTDPNDFYNGSAPKLTVLSGDKQIQQKDSAYGSPFVVLVTDNLGNKLPNAPVKFSVLSGDISLAGWDAWQDVVSQINADDDGLVTVYTRFGSRGGIVKVEAIGNFGAFDFAVARERFGADAGRFSLTLDYYGAPNVSLLGNADYTGEDLDQLQQQKIGLWVWDSDWNRPIQNIPVIFISRSGDATVDASGDEPVFTDFNGGVEISVTRGSHFSSVSAEVLDRTYTFEVDQQIPGGIEIMSSSLGGGDGSFPANGVPIFLLSRPLSENIFVDGATGQFRGGNNPNCVSSGIVSVNFQQPTDLLGNVMTAVDSTVAVPGKWMILPGRKAIAFYSVVPYSDYNTFCFFNVKHNISKWLQYELSFNVNVSQSCVPFRLVDGFVAHFKLQDTDGFKAAIGKVSSQDAYILQIKRGLDSFVVEASPKVLDFLPEDGSVNVSTDVSPMVRFTQPIDVQSIGGAVLSRMDDLSPVQCVYGFDYDRNVLTITPEDPLLYGTCYRIKFDSSLKNLSGDAIEAGGSWTFTTAKELNRKDPLNSYFLNDGISELNRNNIQLDRIFILKVDSSMDPGLMQNARISIFPTDYPNQTVVTTSVYDQKTGRLTVAPTSQLDPGVRYSINISPGVSVGAGAAAGDGGSGIGADISEESSSLGVNSFGSITSQFSTTDDSTNQVFGSQLTENSTILAKMGITGRKPPRPRIIESPHMNPDGSFVAEVPDTFTFPFAMNSYFMNEGEDLGVLCIEITEPDGSVIKDTRKAPRFRSIQDLLKPDYMTTSFPIKVGSVLRISNIGVSKSVYPAIVSVVGPETVFKQLSTVFTPAQIRGNYPDVMVSERSKALKSNHLYISFQRCSMDPEQRDHPPGPPVYYKSLVDFSDVGRFTTCSIAQGGDEMLLCPVIVEDERKIRSNVLNNKIGVCELAPRRVDSKDYLIDLNYAKALTRYYSVQYPLSGIAGITPSEIADEQRWERRPAMPQLTARIKDAPQDVLGRWRLRVRYDRGNGRRDTAKHSEASALNVAKMGTSGGGERHWKSPNILGSRTQPEDIVDIPGRPYPDALPKDVKITQSQDAPSNFAICKDPRREDNIPTYTDFMPANEVWRIFETPEWTKEVETRGLFGGEATLYWIPKDNVEGSKEFVVARFRIGGENPSNYLARNWLEGRDPRGVENVPGAGPNRNQDGELWFAYAIAKHETAEYRYQAPGESEASYYNQFRGSPTTLDSGYPAWNNDGATKPGGYGIFQVTGNASVAEANIPRRQIWDWMENMKAGGKIIASKRSEALRRLDQWRADSNYTRIPDLIVNGIKFFDPPIASLTSYTSHTILDANTMKGYNGNSKPKPTGFVDSGGDGLGHEQGFFVTRPQLGSFCYWENLAKNKPIGWRLSRFNSLTPSINYVSLVCGNIDPGSVLLGNK